MTPVKFDIKANISPLPADIINKIEFIECIEIQPLIIEGESYEWCSEEKANAFGVYIRYTQEAIKQQSLNPSDWLADFDTIESANSFKQIIETLLSYKAIPADSTIKSISTDNTGGNIYNDVVTLKDGTILRISEGAVTVYKDAAQDEDNNPYGTIFLQ